MQFVLYLYFICFLYVYKSVLNNVQIENNLTESIYLYCYFSKKTNLIKYLRYYNKITADSKFRDLIEVRFALKIENDT